MRLLICDDHKPLLEALTLALTDDGHTVVATAHDPDGAVAAAREHQPDACLLDMNFPHATGLSAIARILAVSANTKVVMLSGSISTDLVADAIGQGAQGFVGKEKPVTAIIEALELAVQGHLAVDPIFVPDPTSQVPHADPLTVLRLLSDREWELMRYLMDGLSTEEMAEQLGVHGSTARTHLENLLGKFGVRSRQHVAGLLMTAS